MKRKPEVFYKPKSPIDKLSDTHAEHMDNIINGGLMRKITPDDIKEHLLKQNYIRHTIGGLVPTNAGHYAFMMWQKGQK